MIPMPLGLLQSSPPCFHPLLNYPRFAWVYLPFVLSHHLPTCLFASLPTCLFVYLTICLVVYLPTCLFVSLPTCLFVYLTICLVVYLPTCLFIYLFTCRLHSASVVTSNVLDTNKQLRRTLNIFIVSHILATIVTIRQKNSFIVFVCLEGIHTEQK